jgi:hypothetical protein
VIGDTVLQLFELAGWKGRVAGSGMLKTTSGVAGKESTQAVHMNKELEREVKGLNWSMGGGMIARSNQSDSESSNESHR